jgi:hypothetical protein
VHSLLLSKGYAKAASSLVKDAGLSKEDAGTSESLLKRWAAVPEVVV